MRTARDIAGFILVVLFALSVGLGIGIAAAAAVEMVKHGAVQ